MSLLGCVRLICRLWNLEIWKLSIRVGDLENLQVQSLSFYTLEGLGQLLEH
jgi:hypothetical protein